MGEVEIPSYGKKDQTITTKEIILNAIDKCRREGSKQMTKGGTELIDGQLVNTPDQGLVYIESVKTLYDLLEFFFDEKAKINCADTVERLHTMYNEQFEVYLQQEDRQIIFKSNPTTFMGTEIGEKHKQILKVRKVDLYRLMFRDLFALFKRKNELSKVRKLGYAD